MGNDVIYNKIETIERCTDRVNEVYEGDYKNLEDYTKQDSIILNIQRACEAAIDIAMHIISEKRLGIPQNSRDAFDVLYSNKMVSADLNKKLKSMIGFRNIAVHNYKALNLEIVREVIEKHMEDFREFIYEINQIK